MAWVPSVSRTCAKRSKRRRIHVMHPVHKNRTGQPWVKPGHDSGGVEMRVTLIGVILTVSISGLPAHAADIAVGKEKAEMCVGCHGDNGISQMENIPSLAGQP